MELIDRILYKYLSAFIDVTTMIILAVLVVVVFINICLRYLFSLPLSWSDELATILLVWLTFFGGAAASRRGKHMKVDELLRGMDAPKQRIMYRIINTLVSFFLIFFIWKGIVFAFSPEIKDQITDALRITNAVYYIPLPIGGILMLPYSLRNIFYGGERGKTG